MIGPRRDRRPGPPSRSARRSARRVGQAQSVLSGLLVEAVEQAGTERETYLALQRLGVARRRGQLGRVRP